ncbi:unnamed protein product [Dibothriocephalus latus]|uniref:arginine--tRNA ligase n=1 Tax=Dibothriocephalus latus TaxID=60516 RepID=A0A3P7RK13_DIBLA|nr:unnamed protein product [Dibothriocephalus latus]
MRLVLTGKKDEWSIVRKTGWSPEKLEEVRKSAHLVLNHPAELKLAKTLCRLPEVLYRLQTELLFHKLCDYLYEVSCVYTEFYDACYCIEQDRKTGKCPLHLHPPFYISFHLVLLLLLFIIFSYL